MTWIVLLAVAAVFAVVPLWYGWSNRGWGAPVPAHARRRPLPPRPVDAVYAAAQERRRGQRPRMGPGAFGDAFWAVWMLMLLLVAVFIAS